MHFSARTPRSSSPLDPVLSKAALGAEPGNAPQVHLGNLGSALSKLCNETHKGISSQGRRLWAGKFHLNLHGATWWR